MKRALAAAVACVSVMASSAVAAPLAMQDKGPASDEMQAVASVYGPWLSKHPEVKVLAARVDLQGKGVGSVAARFVSDATCVGKRCETALLRFDGKLWRPVFEKVAATVETGPGVPGATGENVSSLLVDGNERWEWTGLGRYMPDLRSIGTVFAATGSLPADAVEAARQGTAGGAAGVAVRFRAARLDLGDGHEGLLALAYAPGLCGNVAGCPATLLVRQPDGWVPAWSGASGGNGAVLASKVQGRRDVALAVPAGYVTLRWTGAAYADSSTSFPSQLTPAP